MARYGGSDDLVRLVVVGGIAYVGYDFARNNKLGTSAKKLADEIDRLLGRGGAPPPLPPGTGGTPGTGGKSAAFVAACSANTNFGAQMEDWQTARAALGQNALDWSEFRAHQVRIFAPDPGTTVPSEFTTRARGVRC